MTNINKLIKKENLEVLEFFDCPSKKGTPTDKSVVITVLAKSVLDKNMEVKYKIGMSVKSPIDLYKPRIGKSVAYRKMHSYDIYISDLDGLTISLFSLLSQFNIFTKKGIEKRIINIMYEYTYDMVLIQKNLEHQLKNLI